MHFIFTNLILTIALEVGSYYSHFTHEKNLGVEKLFAKGHTARLGLPSGITPKPMFCCCGQR